MKVAIAGGGILGVSLGYYLTRAGVDVEIYEASGELGGLAGQIRLEDGTRVDRFYHAILSSDRRLLQLCDELGIAEQLRFQETKMGFFHHGQIYSMNNIIEFLRFPPLGWIDRFRLGLTVLYAQLVRDWKSLEGISVEKWLTGWSGRGTYENIWRPMLAAKFDGGFDTTPATYIWSRLVRMKSTRGGAGQKEEAGHLIGGYPTLLNAMAEKIRAAGGKIFLGCPVEEILIEDGQVRGLRVAGEERSFDAVVSTLQIPFFRRLIPGAPEAYREFLGKTGYLGILSVILVLDRPLTGYWTLNITDSHIPFTGVIETTAYIDPRYTGGYHLVYLPKYTAPGSEWQKKTDDEIRSIWLENLEGMFPDFDRRSICDIRVYREPFVEPLHGLNETSLIPAVQTSVRNLYLATTAQIYPALTNGESISRHAQQAAESILERQPI